MKYYKKLVICKKIIHKWVSIYETCECDIEATVIHRFPWVDGCQRDPRDKGVIVILFVMLLGVLILTSS